MRLRPFFLLAIALLVAGGVAIAVRNWFQAERQTIVAERQDAPAKASRAVLVARRALPMGTLLRLEDIAWKPWPDEAGELPYVLQGDRKLEEFVGYVVRSPLLAGEPMTADRIVGPTDRGFMAAVLPLGKRAVSIAVNPISDVSGFVFPGDHVDILLTHSIAAAAAAPGQAPPTDRRATETLLSDIRVLAVDQKVEAKDGETIVAHTATLEVTTKQSEILALSADLGKLSLSLRSLAVAEDGNPVPGKVAPRSYTLDSQASPLLVQPKATAHPVTILHGGTAEDVVFGAPK